MLMLLKGEALVGFHERPTILLGGQILHRLPRQEGEGSRTGGGDAKEFERQTILEGYKEAIGEIYETAIPALNPSYPKTYNVLFLFSILGLAIAMILTFYRRIITNHNDIKKNFWRKDYSYT